MCFYLAVNVNNTSYCGARGLGRSDRVIGHGMDAELYKHCLELTQIEYCNPFNLKNNGTSGW